MVLKDIEQANAYLIQAEAIQSELKEMFSNVEENYASIYGSLSDLARRVDTILDLLKDVKDEYDSH